MSDVFAVIRPKGTAVPIVISCPHSGTEIPADLRTGPGAIDAELAAACPDTDWFVHELYGFARELGMTLIHARYSRFVIDLNRDPAGAKLYTDGRQETGLVPVRTFAGQNLYKERQPDAAEMARRVRLYYDPYHQQVAALVRERKRQARHVLFFDAHSIKRQVKTVRPEPFPDMILGDQRGKTAHAALSTAALAALREGGQFQVSHNDPFMGGYLTRSFGNPLGGVHALQLEMSQDVYMDEDLARRDPGKQAVVASRLQTMLQALQLTLRDLA